jgi:hypothetical protein
MKFRRTCTVCNTTFFSPDRKAAYCSKCIKKRIVKHVPAEARVAVPVTRVAPRPAPPPPPMPQRSKAPRPAKTATLTPDLRKKIVEVYEAEFASRSAQLKDTHAQIANRLWVKRQLVADVIRDLTLQQPVVTEDMKRRAIEMYKRFVESGHRPDGGRRRAISAALDLPYKQVMKIIREWSLAQYEQSPTPNPTRQQLFEIEKLYWNELHKGRFRLTELPTRMAEHLGFVTRWQVLRWLDVLHDDERAFANVPDPALEVQQQILNAYAAYLESPTPPEHGLHYSIAGQLEKVSPRQVHKVLQTYRHKKRAEYPLI